MYKTIRVVLLAVLVTAASAAQAAPYLTNTWFDATRYGWATYTGERTLNVMLVNNTRNQGTREYCIVVVYGKKAGKLTSLLGDAHSGLNNNCVIEIPQHVTENVLPNYDNIEVRFTDSSQRRLGTATFKVKK